ncbi:hypothetical protein [Clostridium botulinum]|uniref:hypothetical protein n=1 Tax=Clostridium botulinum TaxID=1491 RepID=UPI0013C57F56|nr:hypothetical protein [Clostridium botulinum]
MNESKVIVDVKPYKEFNHVFQGILLLEPLDKVILTYNTGELAFAEFISIKENKWDFRINNEMVFFNQVRVPTEYKNYTFSVNNIKYALVLRKGCELFFSLDLYKNEEVYDGVYSEEEYEEIKKISICK